MASTPRVEYIQLRRDNPQHMLYYAVCTGDLKQIRRLFGQGKVDVEGVVFGQTPLLAAIDNGHLDVVRYLVKKRSASLAATDDKARNALFLAVVRSKLEIVKFLVAECGADPIKVLPTQNYSPVRAACELGRLDILRYFVEEAKAPIQQHPPNEMGPLYSAVAFRQMDVVRYLIDEVKMDPHLVMPLLPAPLTYAALAVQGGDFPKQADQVASFKMLKYLVEEHKLGIGAVSPHFDMNLLTQAAFTDNAFAAAYLMQSDYFVEEFEGASDAYKPGPAVRTAIVRNAKNFVREFVKAVQVRVPNTLKQLRLLVPATMEALIKRRQEIAALFMDVIREHLGASESTGDPSVDILLPCVAMNQPVLVRRVFEHCMPHIALQQRVDIAREMQVVAVTKQNFATVTELLNIAKEMEERIANGLDDAEDAKQADSDWAAAATTATAAAATMGCVVLGVTFPGSAASSAQQAPQDTNADAQPEFGPSTTGAPEDAKPDPVHSHRCRRHRDHQ